jgi:hypothetical protein
MRITHSSSIVRTFITLVVSACIGGNGSGVIGVAGGTNANTTPPVLGFFVQPNSANAGQTISPPVQVVARDSLGSVNTLFNGSITVTLASNSTGATLSGTTTVRAVSGIATFNTLAVSKAGTYRLQASAGGAAAVSSNAFPITTVTTP